MSHNKISYLGKHTLQDALGIFARHAVRRPLVHDDDLRLVVDERGGEFAVVHNSRDVLARDDT